MSGRRFKSNGSPVGGAIGSKPGSIAPAPNRLAASAAYASAKRQTGRRQTSPSGPSDAHALEPFGPESYLCARCGSYWVPRADAHAPIWCEPSPSWLAAHPTDDMALRRDGWRGPYERAS